MSVTFPEIRVGDPIRLEGLAVFPLFAQPTPGVDYDLSHEALNKGTITVEEISEAGSVPDLAVDNMGDLRVLFLEGEELIGAKQNRILNTSVLIAAHTKSKIPVSCVEAGRWGYKSRHCGSGGTHSPSMLRRVLKASVSKSVNLSSLHMVMAIWTFLSTKLTPSQVVRSRAIPLLSVCFPKTGTITGCRPWRQR